MLFGTTLMTGGGPSTSVSNQLLKKEKKLVGKHQMRGTARSAIERAHSCV